MWNVSRPEKLLQTPPAALQATPQYVLGLSTAAPAPPAAGDWGPARGGRSGACGCCSGLPPTCGSACGGTAPPGFRMRARADGRAGGGSWAPRCPLSSVICSIRLPALTETWPFWMLEFAGRGEIWGKEKWSVAVGRAVFRTPKQMLWSVKLCSVEQRNVEGSPNRLRNYATV